MTTTQATDDTSPKREWVKPRISWGPIPTSRHSAVSWQTDNRYMFIYGGEVAEPEANEKNTVHSLDTRKSRTVLAHVHRFVFMVKSTDQRKSTTFGGS